MTLAEVDRLVGLRRKIGAYKIAISREQCEESLVEFIRQAWHVVEPGTPYVHGWHIDAICAHLEAITFGLEDDDGLTRLLANVPPGMMKSLAVSVFWPCWEWSRYPHLRYLCASHSVDLAIRDNLRMRRLIESEWYQQRWGHRVKLTRDQSAKTRFENTAGGFRAAVAAGSVTGHRADRVIIDDPHSVESAASDDMRQTTITWFLEAVPTRLNNPAKSAIVVIMQRLHDQDVSGVILDRDLGYTHLMLPMEYEPDRACSTDVYWQPHWSSEPELFEDPRSEVGELIFPERFPASVVTRDKAVMGTFAVSGQFQQRPAPRGGGIIKREYWQSWDIDVALQWGYASKERKLIFPDFDYLLAVLDTAYTEKEENDPSAMVLWGVFKDKHNVPKVMLAWAWSEHLEFNSLVEKTAETCRKYGGVHKLVIEAKAAGISVAQEIRRKYSRENWSVQLIDPGRQDKIARAYSVQGLMEAGLVYAPFDVVGENLIPKSWADGVISECETFPKGAHDDRVDCVTMGLSYLRQIGMLRLGEEIVAETHDAMRNYKQPVPLYPGA